MNPPGAQAETQIANTGTEISAEVLATLAEIGEEVNSSLDLDEVLARSAALIKRHIDYEIFGVLLIEGDGSYLRHRFAIGYSHELAENLRIPLGQGITGTAAATGHSVRVSDTGKDPRYINAIDSVRSELAVPLMLRGKCIGVLDIQSRHLDYFTRDQQNILTLLASRLAVAIENARLFQKVRTQADTLLLLSEVGRETGAILAVEELLRRAAEQTKRVIDYQILSIMLYDEEQKVFRHRVDVKHGHRVQGKLRANASEGIVGAAATLKEPVLVPDVTVDPRYLMVNPETRSGFAGGEKNSGSAAAACADGRLRFGDGRPVSFRAGSVRRPLRVSALRTAATGNCAGRREREGHGRGSLRSGGHRNHAESGPTETAARGNAEANEPAGGRTAHRGTIHDGVLRHVAKRPAEAASGKRRAVAAAALQGGTLRQDRIDGLSDGHLRRSDLRRMGSYAGVRKYSCISLGWNRGDHEQRRAVLRHDTSYEADRTAP